ncbi:MAG: ferrous iron transport protein B [Campylobacter sp.]|nr:ferrous iron transport protein B [Campylobacter sp.]
MQNIKIALAGQPNCGKSTIFNLISGLRQHIANYPGVTVDKKVGSFTHGDYRIVVSDLPGTYSFSSYSPEEIVAKKAILFDDVDIIVNIVDASNLKKHLYLTFQLLEIGKPVIVVLNMMDVAKNRGFEINTAKISSMLKCPVIEASGARGDGKAEITNAIIDTYNKKEEYKEFKIDYEELEDFIKEIEDDMPSEHQISKRWFAIKALENDKVIMQAIKDENLQNKIISLRDKFKRQFSRQISTFLATFRYDSADIVYSVSTTQKDPDKKTLTDKIDAVILNPWIAFPILFMIIFIIYELAIVCGYKLTDYTWPILAGIKNFTIDILPNADLTDVPMITDFGIWMVNSANSLLNYIPIFLILFALIAILEDVGYMPRMAFILDRVFKKFGLHGQSTLPLVLGGAFVGGCAVPGIMSTRGIADERARMATILTVPLMNCLAKVPFYTLILGAFFPNNMGIMMFFISTITIFTALLVAKFITSTVLKNRVTAPFVMELPPYHLPTFKGVVRKAIERVIQYIKKVVTIVLAVAVILFALLEFPGLSKEKHAYYDEQTTQMLVKFDKKIKNNSYYEFVNERQKVSELLNYYDNYRAKKMAASKESAARVDEKFLAKNAEFYKFVRPEKDKDAGAINKALRTLSKDRNKILRDAKNDKINNSILGMVGRVFEPITQFAGFDWKINVAFLSSFAARESAVATLGAIYESGKATDESVSEEELENSEVATTRIEENLAQNSGYTQLHAVAIIIFMLLTPPCIASMMVVKLETGSYKWMSFAIFFPMLLAILVSSIVFSVARLFKADALTAMSVYYGCVLLAVIIIGLKPNNATNWSGGLANKN